MNRQVSYKMDGSIVEISEGHNAVERHNKRNLRIKILNIKKNKESYVTNEAFQAHLAIYENALKLFEENEKKMTKDDSVIIKKALIYGREIILQGGRVGRYPHYALQENGGEGTKPFDDALELMFKEMFVKGGGDE